MSTELSLDTPQAGAPKGFFASLFDFSFTYFVTPKIVKFVYAAATILSTLGWLVLVVVLFTQSAAAGIAVLVLGPLGVVVNLLFIRITLEYYLALVRMSQDIHHRLPIAR
jgi:hypothetical protein